MIVLGLLLLAVAELAVLVWVAGYLGVLETVGLVLLFSLGGAWLVKRAGVGLILRARGTVAQRRAPTAEVIDGLLLAAAGVLFLVPGFITDVVALFLLIPPTRALARGMVLRKVRGGPGTKRGRVWMAVDGRFIGSDVIDVDGSDGGGRGQGRSGRSGGTAPGELPPGDHP